MGIYSDRNEAKKFFAMSSEKTGLHGGKFRRKHRQPIFIISSNSQKLDWFVLVFEW